MGMKAVGSFELTPKQKAIEDAVRAWRELTARRRTATDPGVNAPLQEALNRLSLCFDLENANLKEGEKRG